MSNMSEFPDRGRYDRVYKLVVIGDTGTGKSQIVSRFTGADFCENSEPTIVMEHARKILREKRICAHVWDMAGRDMFRMTTNCYIKQALGAMIVYDVTKIRSFESATQWFRYLKTALGSDCPVTMLVGNKCDLRNKRSISTQEGLRLAEENNALFIETSARDDINVTEAFQRMVDSVNDRVIQAELQRDVKAGAGLECGAKALKEVKPTSEYSVCIQTQPTPRLSLREATQVCAEQAKVACSRIACCFY